MIAGITQFCKNPQSDAEYAFGFYNRSDKKNNALNLISNKFQSISNKDIESINALLHQSQVASKWTDLYKATYECLDWINKQGGNFSSKQIIIIGTGKALSESPIKHQECIKRAKDLQIQISAIGLKSDDRYAFDNFNLLVEKNPEAFINAENSNVIDAAINKYIENNNYNNYAVSFDTKTSKDGKKHDVKINVKGKEFTQSYVAPKDNSFIGKYLYWLIGILIAIIILIIIILVIKSSKKKKDAALLEAMNQNTGMSASELTATSTTINNNTEIKDINPHKRAATQITTPPSSITIINNGKTENIGIIKGITSFGRNKTNNIVIENDTVSGNHFTLQFNGIDCILTNLSSSNGTIVNGVKQNKTAIYAGDVIKTGNVEIYFK